IPVALLLDQSMRNLTRDVCEDRRQAGGGVGFVEVVVGPGLRGSDAFQQIGVRRVIGRRSADLARVAKVCQGRAADTEADEVYLDVLAFQAGGQVVSLRVQLSFAGLCVGAG